MKVVKVRGSQSCRRVDCSMGNNRDAIQPTTKPPTKPEPSNRGRRNNTAEFCTNNQRTSRNCVTTCVREPMRLTPTGLKSCLPIRFVRAIAIAEVIPPPKARRNPGVNRDPTSIDPSTTRMMTTTNICGTPSTIIAISDETLASPIFRNGSGVGMKDSMTNRDTPTAVSRATVVTSRVVESNDYTFDGYS